MALGAYPVCTNDEFGFTLTFFTVKPNLIPNAFILEKSCTVHLYIISQS